MVEILFPVMVDQFGERTSCSSWDAGHASEVPFLVFSLPIEHLVLALELVSDSC